jgi:hypothetical protein
LVLCNWSGVYFVYELRFLPRYSPMLNPIEEEFGEVKGDVRTQLAGPRRSDVLGVMGQAWGHQGHERDRILSEAITQALRVVTPRKVRAHEGHSLSLFTAALAGEDL